MHIRILTLIIITSLFAFTVSAQRFGGTRPGARWKQINTNTARIIYPAGLDSQAMEIASVVQYLAKTTSVTLGDKHRKVPIVLQNQPVISNGYVGLAPFRSEFYLAPPTGNLNLGTLPFHLQLAAHEFRHAQQYMNFKKGLSKAGAIILGEEGQAVMNALAVPDWFFEGDAVFQETNVTQQGRGRIPYFFNEFKVLRESGTAYKYMQLRNGSYRHLYPDHYNLGYLLVSYGYEKYGKDFWRKVTDDAARFRGLFYPFQKAIKKHAGINFNQFVNAAIADFNKQVPEVAANEKRKPFVTDLLTPQPLSPDSTIWLKKSGRAIPRFVLQTDTDTRKLISRRISSDDYYAQRNGKLVYTAYSTHPRWTWTEYSDVVLLDINTRKEKKITTRQRYFSPDINEAGTEILVVENDIEGNSRLVILSAEGEIIKKIEFPLNIIEDSPGMGVFTTPKFSGNNDIVTGIRFSNGKNALVEINRSTGAFGWLTPATYQVLGPPQPGNAFTYTTASLKGEDRIIRIQKGTGRISMLAGSSMQYAPVASSGNKLRFSEFTINGNKAGEAVADNSSWTEITPEEWNAATVYFRNKSAKPEDILNQTNEKFSSERFPKTKGLFHIHSWRPYFDDPDWSFTVYGQNVLNTMQTELAYTYNSNDRTNTVGFTGVFGGLFPYIRAGVDYTFDRSGMDQNNKLYEWSEMTVTAGLQLPLQFTGGRFYKNLSLLTTFNNESVRFKGVSGSKVNNLHFNYLRSAFSYSSFIQQATQHIFPRFGFKAGVDYRNILDNYKVHQLLAIGSLYLPGLHVNHNLVLDVAWQKRDSIGNYTFSNSFPYARGYSAYNFYKMFKASANYHLPLIYPDWGFGQIVYFQRIRANFFYDFSRIGDNFRYQDNKVRYTELDQRSTGMELFFDTRWWNQQPVTFGVRYSRLLDELRFGRNVNQFEFILPVNLF